MNWGGTSRGQIGRGRSIDNGCMWCSAVDLGYGLEGEFYVLLFIVSKLQHKVVISTYLSCFLLAPNTPLSATSCGSPTRTLQ